MDKYEFCSDIKDCKIILMEFLLDTKNNIFYIYTYFSELSILYLGTNV